MRIIIVTYLNQVQKSCVYKLWNHEYPQELRYNDISEFDEYLNGLIEQEHYLLINKQDIIAWAVTFKRDDERWFAIIVSSAFHRKVYGTLILNAIKKKVSHLVGWVVEHDEYLKMNSDYYYSPLIFYKKNHFKVLENSSIKSGKIVAAKISWKRDE